MQLEKDNMQLDNVAMQLSKLRLQLDNGILPLKATCCKMRTRT